MIKARAGSGKRKAVLEHGRQCADRGRRAYWHARPQHATVGDRALGDEHTFRRKLRTWVPSFSVLNKVVLSTVVQGSAFMVQGLGLGLGLGFGWG